MGAAGSREGFEVGGGFLDEADVVGEVLSTMCRCRLRGRTSSPRCRRRKHFLAFGVLVEGVELLLGQLDFGLVGPEVVHAAEHDVEAVARRDRQGPDARGEAVEAGERRDVP